MAGIPGSGGVPPPDGQRIPHETPSEEKTTPPPKNGLKTKVQDTVNWYLPVQNAGAIARAIWTPIKNKIRGLRARVKTQAPPNTPKGVRNLFTRQTNSSPAAQKKIRVQRKKSKKLEVLMGKITSGVEVALRTLGNIPTYLSSAFARIQGLFSKNVAIEEESEDIEMEHIPRTGTIVELEEIQVKQDRVVPNLDVDSKFGLDKAGNVILVKRKSEDHANMGTSEIGHRAAKKYLEDITRDQDDLAAHLKRLKLHYARNPIPEEELKKARQVHGNLERALTGLGSWKWFKAVVGNNETINTYFKVAVRNQGDLERDFRNLNRNKTV